MAALGLDLRTVNIAVNDITAIMTSVNVREVFSFVIILVCTLALFLVFMLR